MAICPKCGASIGVVKVCPYCGEALGAKANKVQVEGASKIDQIKEVTNDFKERPTCSDDEFKSLVVSFLSTASLAEKGIYESRIKAYLDNYLNGGNGIVNNPVPVEYAHSGAAATEQGAIAEAALEAAARVVEPPKPKVKKPRKKIKKKVLIPLLIVGGLVLVGGGTGAVIGIRNAIVAANNTETHITFDQGIGSGGTTSTTVYYDSYLRNIGIPSKYRYIFNGYYTGKNGSGTQIYDADGRGTSYWNRRDFNITLYAYWTESYGSVVYFDNDGGTGGPSGGDRYYVTDTLAALTSLPTKYGYEFLGYYDGSSVKYYDSYGIPTKTWTSKASSVTLYAHWDLNGSIVTFDSNGEYGGPSGTKTFVYGETPADLSSSELPYTYSSYVFGGYYDSTWGGTQYFDKNGKAVREWDKTSEYETLYARWNTEVRVSFSAWGGSGGPDYEYLVYGEIPDDLDSYNLPYRDGYIFAGYYSSTSGGTQYFDSEGKAVREWDYSYSTTLYAQWHVLTSISFSANGGQGGPSMKQCLYGETPADLDPETLPYYSNYVFDGYYDSSSDYSTQYFDSEGKAVREWDKDITSYTLYAHWRVRTQVTFNSNGGTGGPYGAKYITYGYVPANLSSSEIPTRDGYLFAGYYDGTSTSYTQYFDSKGRAVRSWDKNYTSFTLYAGWKSGITTYFNSNGGTGGVTGTKQFYYYETPDRLTEEMPTRYGYTFVGYGDTSSANSATQYFDAYGYPTRPWNKSSSTTLYAMWRPDVTVSFDANDGYTGTMFNNIYSYGQLPDALEEDQLPTRSGYYFDGFYDSSYSGDGIQYFDAFGNPTRTMYLTSSTTLYAHWASSSYYSRSLISFDANGGTGGPSDKYIYSGNYLSDLNSSDLPTRDGYVFTGYYTMPSSGTQYYGSDGSGQRYWYNYDSEYTLYAHWEELSTDFYGSSFTSAFPGSGTFSVSSSYRIYLDPSDNTYGGNIDGRESGSYTNNGNVYNLSGENLAYMSDDGLLLWTPYAAGNEDTMTFRTYIMINSSITDSISSDSLRYVRYRGTEMFDYTDSFDESCDVILVSFVYKGQTKTYLLANNKIYSNVTWESSKTRTFSSLTYYFPITVIDSEGNILCSK